MVDKLTRITHAHTGLLGPVIFTWLLSRHQLFLGYLLAAALMIVAGVVEWCLGLDAEGKALEQLAPPLP